MCHGRAITREDIPIYRSPNLDGKQCDILWARGVSYITLVGFYQAT